MNWRLLSEDEKRANYLGRLRRNSLRKKLKRQKETFGILCEAGGKAMLHMEATELDGFNLFVANLRATKTLVRRMRRQMEFIQLDPTIPTATPSAESKSVARPARKLRGKNPGVRLINFQAPEIMVPEMGTIRHIACIFFKEMIERNYCKFRLLELAVKLLEQEPQSVAFLLNNMDFDPGFTLDEMQAYKATIKTKEILKDFQTKYSIVVAHDGIEVCQGCWSFFDHIDAVDLFQIEDRIPERLRRIQYLVNTHQDELGNITCIDFHSINYTGLFRLEFEQSEPKQFPPEALTKIISQLRCMQESRAEFARRQSLIELERKNALNRVIHPR